MRNIAVLVFLALIVLVWTLDDCNNHPLKDYVLNVWGVTNKGVTCIVDPISESGCFTQDAYKVSDMYVSDGKPTTEGATSICSDITNSCVDPAKVGDYVNLFETFVEDFRDALSKIFDYQADQDTRLEGVLQDFLTAASGFVLNMFNDNSTVAGFVDDYFTVDFLLPLAKDGLTTIFDELGKIVIPLVDSLEKMWAHLEVYAKGVSCVAADADIDVKVSEFLNDGVLLLNNNIFSLIGQDIYNEIKDEDGAIYQWASNLATKLQGYYNNIRTPIDDTVTDIGGFVKTLWEGAGSFNGILESILKVNIYDEIPQVINVGLITGAIQRIGDCIFPQTVDGYCVPFLDEILWLVNGLELLFKGKFNDFFDYISDGFNVSLIETTATPEQLEIRDNMIQKVKLLSVPNVTLTADGGYDVTTRASASSIVVPGSNPAEDKYIEIFGYSFTETEVLYMGAGVIGFLALLVIIVGCCCRSSKSAPMAQPFAAASPYGAMGRPSFAQPSFGPSPSMNRGMPPSMGRGHGMPPSMGGPRRY